MKKLDAIPNEKQLRVRKMSTGQETLAYQYDGDFIASFAKIKHGEIASVGGRFYAPEWVENSYNSEKFKIMDQGDLYMEKPAVRKGYPPDFGLVEPGDYIIKCVGIEYAYYFVKKDEFEKKYEILEEIDARPQKEGPECTT